MPRHARSLAFLLLSCLTPAYAYAAAPERFEEDDKGIFSLVFENDLFAGEDRDYTNGVRLSYLSPEEHMPGWANSLANMLPLASDGNKRISVALGQNMYAPGDLSVAAPIPGDHPYAGWLYGSVGMVSDTGKTLDNVMLTIGVVGPMSGAEHTQRFVHDVVDGDDPKGWNNQLHNEPGIVLTYERKWRGMYEFSPFGLGVDVTPHAGVNLGNINTDATVGATFRLGYDLPADYGPPRIRPSLPGSDFFLPTQELGGYLFTTVAERAVARDIFLDGNTFESSAHVNKEYFVSTLQIGAALTYGQSRLSYTQVFSTKEYTTQKHHPNFGVLTYSYRF